MKRFAELFGSRSESIASTRSAASARAVGQLLEKKRLERMTKKRINRERKWKEKPATVGFPSLTRRD